MTRPRGDGLPWYRHVWPWFIVVLLGVSVLASLSTVVLAVRGQDSLVRDDWYKDGLAINRSLESLERATERGIRAELRFDPEKNRVAAKLQGEGTERLEELMLVLSHATRAEQDRTILLSRVATGDFDGSLPLLPPGRYYASLEPAASANGPERAPDSHWRLSRAFYAGASPTLALGEGG